VVVRGIYTDTSRSQPTTFAAAASRPTRCPRNQETSAIEQTAGVHSKGCCWPKLVPGLIEVTELVQYVVLSLIGDA
jgi:hypothetical protein